MAKQKKGRVYTAVTGLIMGMAEVVPGVSGGTIAFVAGIYEKLLESIDQVRAGVTDIPKNGLKTLLNDLDWTFLFSLISGMLLGIVTGVFAITHFLEHYPPVIWAFFFGLIVASSIYMLGKIKLSGQTWVLVILGVVVAYVLGTYNYGSGNEVWWFIMLCGMIAITALVLPGISGSFMLLMLGMYTFIIRDTVKGLMVDFSFDKVTNLVLFGLGCLVGLFSIARFLRWALHRYHDGTVALLTGFMVGSLQRIWPWRVPTLVLDEGTGQIMRDLPDGEYKIISESLVWPGEYGPDALLSGATAAFVLGLLIIWVFSRYDSGANSSPTSADV